MAIQKMQKVAIIAHKSKQKDLIHELYEEGVLQISVATQGERTVEPAEEINYQAADVDYALHVLHNFANKQTKANAARINTDPEAVRTTVQHTDVLGIVDTLRTLEANDTEANKVINDKETLIEQLALWQDYPYDLAAERQTSFTVVHTGVVNKEHVKQFEATMQAATFVECTRLASNDKHTSYICIVERSKETEFVKQATGAGYTTVQLPTVEGKPQAVIEQAQLQVLEAKKQIEQNTKERATLAIELPKLAQVALYMHWLQERSQAHQSLSHTEQTIMLHGWMPSKLVDGLEAKLHKTCGAVTIIKIKPDEGEEVPVALKNPKWITPFESVTTLYGLPKQSEFDPTVALSPFFLLYFTLCLTDAGYGLMLALIFGIWIARKKLKPTEARLIWLLFLGGIATFIVGILFGGWFGFAPEQAPDFLTKQTSEGVMFKGQIWNLNVQSGIEFLQNLSLILGITHLFFGMFLAGYHKWIHGNKAGAFWQDFTSHIMLGSTILYAFSSPENKTVTLYVLLGAIVLMLWGKGHGSPWYLRPVTGALGMLDFTIGMISNSLSYLRLLALGLVTGAIAYAINQVAYEIGGLFPLVIQIPVTIIIFVLGHLVSIALNTLGSFIHSGRLQFIEFFSQFFEGGGQSFTPFSRKS